MLSVALLNKSLSSGKRISECRALKVENQIVIPYPVDVDGYEVPVRIVHTPCRSTRTALRSLILIDLCKFMSID